MKLAILGGAGRTGRLLVQQALNAGHEVRVLVRSPERFTPKSDRLEVVKATRG